MHACIKNGAVLSLVRGEALAAETVSAQVPTLAAQPFRPGELPSSALIVLDEEAATHAERQAAETGIPTELWLRLGVEAARVVEMIVETVDTDINGVVLALDRAAETAGAMAPLETRRQRAYASHLRVATPRPRLNRRRFSLLLPDQVLAAWSIGAAASATNVSEYVSTLVLHAPTSVVQWEIAAAERGQPLAEWIYAEAFEAFRRRQATLSNSRTGGAEGSGELPQSHLERRRVSRP